MEYDIITSCQVGETPGASARSVLSQTVQGEHARFSVTKILPPLPHQAINRNAPGALFFNSRLSFPLSGELHWLYATRLAQMGSVDRRLLSCGHVARRQMVVLPARE